MRAESASRLRPQAVSTRVRDRIVLEHLPLVRAIAARARKRLPVQVEIEDLVQAGLLGLFQAAIRYDARRNVTFQSYARHRIKGAILDSLRQLDWAPRDLRRDLKRLDSLTQDLWARLGHAPNPDEMAQEMGVSFGKCQRVMAELRRAGLVSAVERAPHACRPRDVAAAQDQQPDHICESRQLHQTLARALGGLPARPRQVIVLYYSNDMTMREIAKVLGVNPSRVSQIHKKALQKMAGLLESEGIRSAEAFVAAGRPARPGESAG